MKEYPSTSREFKVNTKKYTMKKFTLLLQSQIEDESINVTFSDVLLACTSMTKEEIQNLDVSQAEAIYTDIAAFTYSKDDDQEGGEPKKQSPSSLG